MVLTPASEWLGFRQSMMAREPFPLCSAMGWGYQGQWLHVNHRTIFYALAMLSRKSLIIGLPLVVLVLFFIPRGPAGNGTTKALASHSQVKVAGWLYPEVSIVCLLWLVGTRAAFGPSPWPSASKWPSISAFVKAINRAVQA